MTIDFDKRIDQYIRLRQIIKEEDDAHKERMKPKREMLEALNSLILDMLNTTGQDSAKTKFGTAYKKRDVSVTIADGSAFRRHIIGTGDFDLLDMRANKTAVEKFIEENTEPPPGVNYSVSFDVGVRRS